MTQTLKKTRTWLKKAWQKISRTSIFLCVDDMLCGMSHGILIGRSIFIDKGFGWDFVGIEQFEIKFQDYFLRDCATH